MTFDPTKPVQLRDGRKARIICTDAKNPIYPIIALIDDGLERIEFFMKNGSYFGDGGNYKDLVNIEEPTFDINKPFRCGNGNKAVLVHYADWLESSYTCLVAFHDDDGPNNPANWKVNWFTKEGKYFDHRKDPEVRLVNYEPELPKVFDWNKPFKTRSGRTPRYINIHVNHMTGKTRYTVAFQDYPNIDYDYNENGIAPGLLSDLDLINY